MSDVYPNDAHAYQVGTCAVTVEVDLGADRALVGQMFLRPGVAGHAGAETVADRLNDAAPFFPLRVLEPEPATLLVGKGQVRYVLAPSMNRDERVAPERAAAMQIGVQVVLDDGRELRGVLFIDLPPGRDRALDYVNLPNQSFIPIAQADRDCLVNRNHIRHLRDTM